MYEEIKQPNQKERNLARVKIEGKIITIAEGQSFLDDRHIVYLLGPMDNNTVDVFEELPNEVGYEAQSGGYLSCVEVKGDLVADRKFLIHALDSKNMKSHLEKIFALSGNDTPIKVTIEYDKSRALPYDYIGLVREVMGDTEVDDLSK